MLVYLRDGPAVTLKEKLNDQAESLIQSQYTDTGPTSHNNWSYDAERMAGQPLEHTFSSQDSTWNKAPRGKRGSKPGLPLPTTGAIPLGQRGGEESEQKEERRGDDKKNRTEAPGKKLRTGHKEKQNRIEKYRDNNQIESKRKDKKKGKKKRKEEEEERRS